MATQRINVLGANTVPDSSGNVWLEPFTIAATNDAWANLVARFKDSGTKDKLYGVFEVPQNYVGSAKIYPIWTSSATSGNVVWEFGYRTVGGDDTTSLDQSGTEETATVTDAAPTAAFRRLTPSISPTAGNFSAGETVEFYIARDGSSGSDTMAADALLFSLDFEYADA